MPNINLGDTVQIKTKEETIIGTFIPSSDKEYFTIKLESGYNLNIPKNKIVSIKILKKYEISKKIMKHQFNKDLPTISILHTGGTVASKVDYKTGAVSSQFSPEDLIEKFPEIKHKANIRSELISNIYSSNMRFHNYNQIAKAIEKESKSKIKGIIVTHGTDTLHYTSAALSFILENIHIPIILVGSQRSSDRPSTDAYQNLLHAIKFITETDFKGVAICMHSSQNDDSSFILNPCKARKLHTSRRDAFKPVNSNPMAKVGETVQFYEKNKVHEGEFKLKLIKENLKIGILKTHPNLYSKEVENYKSFDALILEGTGLGHISIEKFDQKSEENLKIFNALKKLTKKIPVIMTSQCIFGRTNMNVYSYGRKLLEIGVLNNNSDITTETAFIKVAWLLSNHKKEFHSLWNKNLRGELNERILLNHYVDVKEVN